jgi:hypothetical protein
LATFAVSSILECGRSSYRLPLRGGRFRYKPKPEGGSCCDRTPRCCAPFPQRKHAFHPVTAPPPPLAGRRT